MGADPWEPPLVRVAGARDEPLLLQDAWAAPAVFGFRAPVELVEADPDTPAGSGLDSVVLTASVAARLPADERLHQLRRELAQALPEAVPAPPAVGDWAVRLDEGEAVVSLGVGWFAPGGAR
ncbi:MAG: hypothetical protein ACRDRP_07230 [Pseudonocardiaceae bacterium]